MARRGVHEARGQLDLLSYRLGARTAAGLTLPSFLCIGAQKAGTTWLHANLACHPQLFVPPQKEIHYFDWFEMTSLRAYASVFSGAGARLAGDISPGYSAMGRRRVRAVHRVLPDARVLVLLRDPVERAWSQVLMASRRVGRDPATLSAREALSYVRSRGARRRGEYTRMLTTWKQTFGPDSVWVGFYDDISMRPAELLSGVFRHLEVDVPTSWADFPLQDRFNAGSGAAPSPELRATLAVHFAAELDQLEQWFPTQVARWREPVELAD